MALPAEGDPILLLHNPRCSKSRATLALLDESGVVFELREYLEEPLTPEEIDELGRRLGLPIQQWLRRGEAAYGEAGLGLRSSAEALREALAAHPILMQRPIAIRGDRAVIGRPPENILALL